MSADKEETVTQLAFYCGWPKAWSTFPLIAEVYGEDEETEKCEAVTDDVYGKLP